MRSEHELAVRYFGRAFQIDPSFRRARLERGILLWRELNRPDEAIADFNALLATDPEYGPALLNRAMVTQGRGRYEAALVDLTAYLKLPETEIEGYRREAERTAALLRELVETRSEQPEGDTG
jgi:tetratricopeptide (TPR) repeat protein